jgi:hypothetical protein
MVDWIYFTLYIHTTRDYKQYSAIADLRTLQFTVTHALGFSVFTSRIQATDLLKSHCNFKSFMQSYFHRLIPFLPLFCNWQFRRLDSIQFLCFQAHILAGWGLEARPFTSDSTTVPYYSSQSQSYIATDGQSISKSWRRAPSGDHDQIFITLWQLRSCFCGSPSLTRGRFCILYMLRTLASVVSLGSESFGTYDHILLSQILDFPFRRLLRLAWSRWKNSTRPPHGCLPFWVLCYDWRSVGQCVLE